jgi:protocatechuate 3,4-dioxygenase beta subunit
MGPYEILGPIGAGGMGEVYTTTFQIHYSYPKDVNAIVSVSLACAMAISALAQDSSVQSGPRGLLPSPLVVSGIVVDSTGQPIKDVRIDQMTVGMDQAPN